MEDFSKYEECHPRDFREVLADFDFDALLSKYGPEGLWVIGNKMREVALEDVQLATRQASLERTIQIADYKHLIKPPPPMPKWGDSIVNFTRPPDTFGWCNAAQD